MDGENNMNRCEQFLPATWFYKLIPEMAQRTFFDIALKKDVKYIELFRQGRLYSVKDWDKKVEEKYKIGHLLKGLK